MSKIKAVLFDADGVIQQMPKDWMSRVETLLANRAKAEAFMDEAFAAEKPCLTGDGDFLATITDLLRRWDKAFSLDEILKVWTHIECSQEMLSLISQLRKNGIVVGLATNQQAFRADYMKHELAYQDKFDALFISCELGVAKPDLTFFQRISESLQIPANQILFFDDRQDNVLSARESGMQAEVFDLKHGVSEMFGFLKKHGINIE
ncbi:MAG: HAD-IA family hydrolase [Pseudomonadales bacterium]|nr:HAD-IA family hydrolase [Pseudomonadales bacterium]